MPANERLRSVCEYGNVQGEQVVLTALLGCAGDFLGEFVVE